VSLDHGETTMTKARRSDAEEPQVDLSGAARAVVRDPGDPRIDAHLAALGLTDEESPARRRRADSDRDAAAEVEQLSRRIGELEGQLRASRARIRVLTIVEVAAGVAILLLSMLLVLR